MSEEKQSLDKTKTHLAGLATVFWDEFLLFEDSIKSLLTQRTQDKTASINVIIDSIKKLLRIEHDISIQFGIDTRNGLVLPERKDTFEVIISPMFQRKNKKLMVVLYNEGKKRLSSEWSVIRYKFWQPSSLETMNLS